MSDNEDDNKKGFSWLGFLFPPFYYAGYGALKKGLILTVLSIIPILGTFGVPIYAGLKAKSDLPIGKTDFKWANVLIIIVFIVVISGALGFLTSYTQTNMSSESTTQSKLASDDSPAIELVKSGIFNNYPNTTIGEGVSNFFSNPTWESFTADDGNTYVNMTGGLNFKDQLAKAILQFRIDSNLEGFEFNTLEINGEPQNQIIINVLLSKMLGGTDEVVNENPSPTTAIKVGEKARVGNFEYLVKNPMFRKTIGNEFMSETADGIYLIVELEILNKSQETRTTQEGMFNIYDAEGNKYEISSSLEFTLAALDIKGFSMRQLQPRIPAKGVLVFEVPNKTDKYTLELSGSFWGTDTIQIQLN